MATPRPVVNGPINDELSKPPKHLVSKVAEERYQAWNRVVPRCPNVSLIPFSRGRKCCGRRSPLRDLWIREEVEVQRQSEAPRW